MHLLQHSFINHFEHYTLKISEPNLANIYKATNIGILYKMGGDI